MGTEVLKKPNFLAGALVFLGALQFIIFLSISEALSPGYKASSNYISDLGVGPSAAIFNSSIFLLGILVLASSCLSLKFSKSRLFSAVYALSGLGAAGVGAFPETTPVLHAVSAFLAFFFGGVSAVAAYRLSKPPMSYFSALAGAISLCSLALFFFTDLDFGLGRGGMQRLVAYPILFWAVAFGAYLMSSQPKIGPHKL